MNNYDDLISDLTKMIAKIEADYKAYLNRIKARASEENDGLEPVYGKDGRLHAPCDGYTFDDVIYGGGQYLHTPLEVKEEMEERMNQLGIYGGSGEKKFPVRTERLKGTPELAKRLKEVFGATAEIETGKVWDCGSCYIYMKSKRNALLTFVANYEKNRVAEERTKEKAQKGTAPSGRVSITGKVLKVKFEDSFYGMAQKMTVMLDNKSTVFGSVPAAISDVEAGDTVTFTATFEHAKEDDTHSFFSRPSKASIAQSVVV